MKFALYFSLIFLKNDNLLSSDSDWYNSVISLATVIPNAAPLCEIKSSHKDMMDSTSFF